MKRLLVLLAAGLLSAAALAAPQKPVEKAKPQKTEAKEAVSQKKPEKAKPKPKIDYKALYKGKKGDEAGKALLDAALKQAGDNWEKLSIARIYYLSGNKTQGEAIIQKVTAAEADADDWLQIGHIYFQAGDWDKAEFAFNKVLQKQPDDTDYLTDIAAYYALHGDREKADALLNRVFGGKDVENGYLIKAGGAFLGVKPE